MHLALSNLGFAPVDASAVYTLLQRNGYQGLEIAPSLFVGEAPYENKKKAVEKAACLAQDYGLAIASMQSIWYGCPGNIFVREEAEVLMRYTEKVMAFAAALHCNNLVFGCPKNRNVPEGGSPADAQPFFSDIAAHAASAGTCIALEANPGVYGTNFCNTSAETFLFAKQVPHLKVNYDLGTLLINGESLQELADNLELVNHVHISEPQLAAIGLHAERRALHRELAGLLRAGGYAGYVSIEMKTQPLEIVERVLDGLAEVFV